MFPDLAVVASDLIHNLATNTCECDVVRNLAYPQLISALGGEKDVLGMAMACIEPQIRALETVVITPTL